ncbi:mCG144796, partial [Mus musculus]
TENTQPYRSNPFISNHLEPASTSQQEGRQPDQSWLQLPPFHGLTAAPVAPVEILFMHQGENGHQERSCFPYRQDILPSS